MDEIARDAQQYLATARDNWVATCAAIAFAFVAYSVAKVVTSPLRPIPGPRIAAWTSLQLAWNNFNGNRTAYIHKLHVQYGETVRIGPNEVSVHGQDVVNFIYAQGTHFLKDPGFYDPMQVDQAHFGIFNLGDKKLHAERRRILSPAFARGNVLRLEDFVKEKSETLIKHLYRRSSKGEASNLWLDFRYFTSDVVCHAALGVDLKMIDTLSTHPFMADVDTSMMMSAIQTSAPWMFRIAQSFARTCLSKTNSFRRNFDAADRALKGFGEPTVRKYHQTTAKDPDSKEIVARLLAAMDDPKSNLSMDDVVAETVDTLVAGTDTTSGTLSYLSWRVYTTPRVAERLRQELDEAVPDLEHWPSSTPATLPRVVPEEGLDIGGTYYLPPRTIVGCQVHSVHRDKKVWGPDAEEWVPERWLTVTKEQEKGFRPFSTGSTACLGITLAYAELYMASARIFRQFDGGLAPGFTNEDMRATDFFLLSPAAHACRLQLRARSAK